MRISDWSSDVCSSDLTRLLVGDWDVLFLDEPTNHLDVEGITWLSEHLKRRWAANAGGLLVVTHDRWFLAEVSTMTWEVHDRVVEPNSEERRDGKAWGGKRRCGWWRYTEKKKEN